MIPQKKTIAALQKLFIIDDQGNYVGEYAVDDECTIGFDDFVTAIGDMPMGDSQTVFIGESKATMLHGAKLSIIAISKGPLNSHDLTWAKATLIAVETCLAQQPEQKTETADSEETASDLKEISPDDDSRIELEEMRKKLQEVETQLEQERWSSAGKTEELRAKDDRLREMEATLSAAKEREGQLHVGMETLKADLDSMRAKIPEDFIQAQKDVEMRVKIMQKKAFELLEREEKLRKREQELSRLVVNE